MIFIQYMQVSVANISLKSLIFAQIEKKCIADIFTQINTQKSQALSICFTFLEGLFLIYKHIFLPYTYSKFFYIQRH